MEIISVPFSERFKARLAQGNHASRPSVPEGTGDIWWGADSAILSLPNTAGTAWVNYYLSTSPGGSLALADLSDVDTAASTANYFLATPDLISGDYSGRQIVKNDLSFFDEAVDDRVSSLLIEGTGITLSYSDVGNTLTISAHVRVSEVDGSPNVSPVRTIVVPNGTLTNDGGGQVTLALPSPLTVRDIDGTPTVSSVSTIRVSNGTLTDDGSGQVTITTINGITVEEVDASPSVANVVKIRFPNGTVTDDTGGQVTIAASSFNLTVGEPDTTPTVSNVNTILFTNGTVTDDGGGQVTIDVTGSGGSITVKEVDGTPDVSGVNTIRFTNGTVTDDGGGQVTVSTGALDDLSDVTITTPADGDVLQYNSGSWVNSRIWEQAIGLITGTQTVETTNNEVLALNVGTVQFEFNDPFNEATDEYYVSTANFYFSITLSVQIIFAASATGYLSVYLEDDNPQVLAEYQRNINAETDVSFSITGAGTGFKGKAYVDNQTDQDLDVTYRISSVGIRTA